ncbi:MAG: aldo/keto reductase [Lachnospiraceae bacterium]|nr:aldo/keto reductase [Lachnospiraceae bacterium]
MEKRLMKKLGIETSLLGFGCMRLPVKDGRIDRERTAAMIDTAYKAGVNYFDTAYPYHGGESEPVVGEILNRYDRSSYFLATKLPCWEIHSLEDARNMLEKQLNRLQKDYVDFYLLHALNRNSFREMVSYGVPEYLAEMKEKGKIRYLGFSFHDEYDAFEEIVNYRDWDFCQIQYNYMDRNDQAGERGVALCTEKGIPLVIMEPIKGGTLATLPEEVMTGLRAIRPEASPASWALRFVGSRPIVHVILSGMSAEDQLADNLNTFTNFEPLSETEEKAIEDTAAAIRARVRIGCTGCRYCMPCPNGVDIPKNFRIWNNYGMYANVNNARWQWSREISADAKPDNCLGCGACEAACPQHLPIIEMLQACYSEMESL